MESNIRSSQGESWEPDPAEEVTYRYLQISFSKPVVAKSLGRALVYLMRTYMTKLLIHAGDGDHFSTLENKILKFIKCWL